MLKNLLGIKIEFRVRDGPSKLARDKLYAVYCVVGEHPSVFANSYAVCVFHFGLDPRTTTVNLLI